MALYIRVELNIFFWIFTILCNLFLCLRFSKDVLMARLFSTTVPGMNIRTDLVMLQGNSG